jgi:hypothetical protein
MRAAGHRHSRLTLAASRSDAASLRTPPHRVAGLSSRALKARARCVEEIVAPVRRVERVYRIAIGPAIGARSVIDMTPEPLTVKQTATGYWVVQSGDVELRGAITQEAAEAERATLVALRERAPAAEASSSEDPSAFLDGPPQTSN